MTNRERIRQQLIGEFLGWLNQSEDNKIIDPDWCKGQDCEDVDGCCNVCFTKWLDKEVKMTNFEKWKKKIAEAKDGYELMETINKINAAHTKWCFESGINSCEYDGCGECKARWLDMEAKEC